MLTWKFNGFFHVLFSPLPASYLITVKWNLTAVITQSEKTLCISSIRIAPVPDKSHM